MTIKPCSVSPGMAGRVADRSHEERKTRLVLGYEVIVAVPMSRRGRRLAAWLAPLSVRTGPLTPAVVEVVKR
ncbi:hypothetical protein AB0C04_20700 [Micromonospora sp. NPDC048909]|uniref:hypothetical protein n=1 Tax=Micromonospora sp. NPDC048909 TaxID=3155643 RepID=UPI003411188D